MELEEQQQTPLVRGKHTWKIKGFSQLTESKYHSDTFSVAGCKWRIVMYPRGNKIADCCSLYLEVADADRFPRGWSIEAKVCLKMINQSHRGYSTTRVTPHHVFSSKEKEWGLKALKNLVDLRDYCRGFVVHNTVVVEAEVVVYKVVDFRTENRQNTNMQQVTTTAQCRSGVSEIKTYFTSLEGFVSSVDSISVSASKPQEEVEEAEQTLRQCLKQSFGLDMTEKLRTALLILTRAGTGGTGISSDQQRSIEALLLNYSDFASGFVNFEVDSSRYVVQNFVKERLVSTMKKNHQTHISYNKLLDDLAGEETLLLEKLEQVKVKQRKLLIDWENLMAESEEVKSRYKDHEKEVADSETRMRRAEEGRAASEAAWSRLRKLFA